MSKEKNLKQMSLLEDSHVNHSALQENKKGQTTTDISGQKCLDSLKKLNQSSLLGRMCKALLTSKTAWYSDRCKTNWKVKVSKSNVSLFQLQASVHGTKETESGLLATPNTMDYLPPRSVQGTKKLMEGHRKGRTKPSNLREQMDPQTMAMYPTPAQFEDRTPPSTTHKMDKKNFQKKMSNLASKVRYQAMYPTPSASCQMDVVAPPETVTKNSSGWSVTRVGTGTKFGAKLNDVVNKMYRTPNASDHKDLAYNPVTCKRKLKQIRLPHEVLKNNKPGGKLNPTFVEFLMGFPMDWTKIDQTESKVSETQSSHNVQESSDLQSKKFYRTPTAMDKGDNSFKYAAKILKGKTTRSESKEQVQKTLSMDVAMEHLKNNKHLIEAYDEKFKTRPQLPNKLDFINYLKKNLDKKSLYAADIVKKTTIDHWLRSDHCFSYPTVQDWNLIKPYLKELKYDYQMTFEIESDWE